MKIRFKKHFALPIFFLALPLVADDTPEWISQIADSIRAISRSEITVTVPSEDDWRQFWSAVSSSLNSGSMDDLANLKPQAEAALEYLDDMPSAKTYADWLRQRLDYFEVADELQRSSQPPAKPPPSKPGSRKKRSSALQPSLGLENSVAKGMFKDVESTAIDGVDMDIPTFIRRRVVIEK